MRSMRYAATLAAVSLALAAGPGLACEAPVHLHYNEPVELEGVLKSGTGHHEAQGDFDYVYLALDQGICLDPDKNDEFAVGTPNPVTKVQVGGEAIEKELPMDKRVRVKGSLFGAFTMWHAEEVLIAATTVEPK